MPTERRIILGKFNDQPVNIDTDHPLYASSIAPEDAPSARVKAPPIDPDSEAAIEAQDEAPTAEKPVTARVRRGSRAVE